MRRQDRWNLPGAYGDDTGDGASSAPTSQAAPLPDASKKGRDD